MTDYSTDAGRTIQQVNAERQDLEIKLYVTQEGYSFVFLVDCKAAPYKLKVEALHSHPHLYIDWLSTFPC